MQTAGEAPGVASLRSLFNDSLAAFVTITRAARQSFGDDHILLVKAELEKVRLLTWGQAGGLASDTHPSNPALEQDYMRSVIASLLASFVRILDVPANTEARYGVIAVDPLTGDLNGRLWLEAINTSPLNDTFQAAYTVLRATHRQAQIMATLQAKGRFFAKGEPQFMVLVNDLKSINDSLHNLLPGIRDEVAAQINSQIEQSNDQRQLHYLTQSSDDINDVVSKTASMRLEMVSDTAVVGGSRTVVPNDQPPPPPYNPNPVPPPQTSRRLPQTQMISPQQTVTPPAQSTSVPPAAAVKKPSDSANQTPYDNRGALAIRTIFSKPNIPTYFIWHVGYENEPIPIKTEPPLHPSFDLMHVPQNLVPYAESLLEAEPEADPQYRGWAPTSTTIQGYAREISLREINKNDIPEKKWQRARGTPSKTTNQIADRLQEITRNGGLGANWTKEQGYQEVRKIVGESEFTWLDPTERYKIRHQIEDLLASSSRERVFPALSAGSVGAVALAGLLDPSHGGLGFVDFLNRVLHGKEIALRLEKDKGRWYGGITMNAITNMIVAEQWLKNIDVTFAEGDAVNVVVKMETRKRQMEGILAFAEKMRWPYMPQVRAALEAYLVDKRNIDLKLWDWMAAVPLPGSFFPVTLMFGLFDASSWSRESMPQGTVQLRQSNFGLVLPLQSYWRSRSPLGKVLGPSDGASDICGWVGPCMVPQGLPNVGQSALVALHSLPIDVVTNATSSAYTSSIPPSQNALWEEPLPPPESDEICQLQAVRLVPAPASASEGYSETHVQIYEAKLDLLLVRADKIVSYDIRVNSMFITVPPCRGTHRINNTVSNLYRYKAVELSELYETQPSSDEIIVINATASGGEVMARAWCCERSRHAALWKRSSDCCFKCALMVASREGINTRVIIMLP